MNNDYEIMVVHKQRVRELLREADEHRLSALAREPKLTLGDRFRKFIMSVNAQLSIGPAYTHIDCALVPAEC